MIVEPGRLQRSLDVRLYQAYPLPQRARRPAHGIARSLPAALFGVWDVETKAQDEMCDSGAILQQRVVPVHASAEERPDRTRRRRRLAARRRVDGGMSEVAIPLRIDLLIGLQSRDQALGDRKLLRHRDTPTTLHGEHDGGRQERIARGTGEREVTGKREMHGAIVDRGRQAHAFGRRLDLSVVYS